MLDRQKILISRATSGLGAGVALGLAVRPTTRPVNLGADTSARRTVDQMPRHHITTASLLQAIDDQRADEASTRWEEISREFMSEESATDDTGHAGSEAVADANSR